MQKVGDILDQAAGKPAPERPANGAAREQACQCGQNYTAKFYHVLDTWFPDECPACDTRRVEERRREVEQLERERRAASEKIRLERIRESIPPKFRDTDRLHPAMMTPAIQKILRWDYQPKGILAFGRTGGGKSRACYLVAQREAEFGRSVVMFGPAEFSRTMSKAYRDRAEERFHAEIQRADLVLLDDLGKEKITARVQEELFALVDYRIAHQKPTLITTNFPGDKLAERFEDGDTAEPFIERLRKHFIPIHVLSLETE